MAVPKKRKKLDDDIIVSAEASSENENATNETKTDKSKKTTTRTSKPKSEKVSDAFHVVDQIDKTTVSALEVHRFQPLSEQGIHIQFKLDLIRLEDILEIGNPPKDMEKKENSIVIDFTIPYIWNLPILNEVTKTIVKELKNMRIIQ